MQKESVTKKIVLIVHPKFDPSFLSYFNEITELILV